MSKNRLFILALEILVFACCTLMTQAQTVQITNGPKIENQAADSATITWSTNVPAGSTVAYGTDPNKLDQTAEESWGGTNHKVQLKSLQPNTTYYYQVRSGQALGTGSGITSQVSSFKTTGSGASASSNPPATQSGSDSETNISIVAGPIPQRIQDTAARLWWQTNSSSSTILMYGTDANNLAQKKQEAWGKQSHVVELSGLQPGTTYYYQVVTSDGRSLDKGSFQTANAQQAQQKFQITHGPVIEKLAPDSVVIAWTTSAPSSSVVAYGSDPSNLNQKAEAPWGQQTHRVTIHNLNANTKYYFQVQTGQAQGTGESLSSAIFPAMTEAAGQQAKVFNTK